MQLCAISPYFGGIALSSFPESFDGLKPLLLHIRFQLGCKKDGFECKSETEKVTPHATLTSWCTTYGISLDKISCKIFEIYAARLLSVRPTAVCVSYFGFKSRRDARSWQLSACCYFSRRYVMQIQPSRSDWRSVMIFLVTFSVGQLMLHLQERITQL